MKIAIVSGGSGGHIFPALAVAEKLKENHEVIFIGSNKKMEAKILENSTITFKGFDIENKKWKILKNIKECKKYIKEEKFDLAIGFGNYISVSFLLACYLLKVKFIIHEQNIISGKANKLLHHFSYKTITSFPSTSLKGKKVLCLGNPREELRIIETIKKKEKSILVVMGSLGSSSVNHIFEKMFTKYDFKEQFTLVSGNNDFNVQKENIKVIPFLENLPYEATKYDLVITRAGATTLKELASLKVPMLIIPSPYVANNHQEYNASFFATSNAAEVLKEKELNEDILKEKILDLLNNPSKLINMRINAYKLSYPNALTNFVKEVNKIG